MKQGVKVCVSVVSSNVFTSFCEKGEVLGRQVLIMSDDRLVKDYIPLSQVIRNIQKNM